MYDNASAGTKDKQLQEFGISQKLGELRTEVMNCRDFSVHFQAEMLLLLVHVSILVNY